MRQHGAEIVPRQQSVGDTHWPGLVARQCRDEMESPDQ